MIYLEFTKMILVKLSAIVQIDIYIYMYKDYRYIFDLEPSRGGLTFEDRGHLGSRCTLPETNSLQLKIGHPKRKGSSCNHPFSGATVDGSG